MRSNPGSLPDFLWLREFGWPMNRWAVRAGAASAPGTVLTNRQALGAADLTETPTTMDQSTVTPSKLRALGATLEKIAQARLSEALRDDRRAARRIPLRQIICVFPVDGGIQTDDWIPLMSFDVSAIGIGACGPPPGLAVGTTVVVDCVPHRNEEIYIPARVMRAQEQVPGLMDLGLQFEFQPAILHGVHGA